MTTQVAPNEGLNSELNSTELGAFIAQNKALFLGLILLIVAAIGGYGIFSYTKAQTNEKAATAFYQFEQGALKKYQEGGLDAAAMSAELGLLLNDYASTSASFATSLLAVDYLTNKGENKIALDILTKMQPGTSLQSYFVNLRKAVVQEDLNDIDGAIASLTELKNNENNLTMGRIELDLGRMYFQKGDMAKAKTHFDKVLTLTTQNVYKSLAKSYLAKIK
ncbi:YfgM family protein [Halobacteriovorax sp. GFR7]|uniref:YfgM family protein n=1 Tax=unclassified Halobacteriovorax TaxID=2639665 RepID=UPI00371871E8